MQALTQKRMEHEHIGLVEEAYIIKNPNLIVIVQPKYPDTLPSYVALRQTGIFVCGTTRRCTVY